MFKRYMKKIYDRIGTEEAMYDTIDIVGDAVEDMRKEAPEAYDCLRHHLERYLYNITLEEAKDIVSHFSNEYDMVPERWTYEQVVQAANQYNVSTDIDRIQLYIVMNMWNMDYARTMKHYGWENKVEVYLMFSCDWLCDSDFGEGKVYRYFIKCHEEEEEE